LIASLALAITVVVQAERTVLSAVIPGRAKRDPGIHNRRPSMSASVERPGRHSKRPICLRLFQRAPEDDKTILVDGTMNANSTTKPRIIPVKNLAKIGPVGVLKSPCRTPRALI
jgi:hypothetical protein